MSPAPTPRTSRGRTGITAESVARAHLRAQGWVIVAGNVIVGRGELDLVALDPEAPDALVIVEVRGTRTSHFGAPEESVDARKLARLQVAALELLRSGWHRSVGLARPRQLRIDVIAVDLDPALIRITGAPNIRHLRGVTR
jgi:Holliday junction resolvase-like predicted endonuclease